MLKFSAENSTKEWSQDGWIIMGCSAAAAVFVGTATLFSIVLVCCLHRHCYQRRRRMMIAIPPSITYRKPIHYYDEVALPKQELGMKINEVYYSTVQ